MGSRSATGPIRRRVAMREGTMNPRVDAGIVFLGTTDLATTSAFYSEVLGLPLVLEQESCRVFRVADAAFLGFCERHVPPSDAGVVLTLVAEDVDGWAVALRRRGVRIERGPVHNAVYGIYHLFVRDPNGYVVEIQRFDDPRWKIAGERQTRNV